MNRYKIAVILLGLPGLTMAAEVCTDIKDDEKRLACYDAQSGAASSPSSNGRSAPSPQDGTETLDPEGTKESTTPVEAEVPEEFGMREPKEGPKEYVTGTIVKVLKSGQIEYLRLDNGQVWREVTDSRMRFREGGKVVITEGILNSYDLKLEGYNKIVKVKRVR